MDVTPPNGTARVGDDLWRERVEMKLETKLDAEHKSTTEKFREVSRDRETLAAEIRHDYVSNKELGLHLDPVKDKIEELESGVWWLIRLIVGGFLATVARFVYMSSK